MAKSDDLPESNAVYAYWSALTHEERYAIIRRESKVTQEPPHPSKRPVWVDPLPESACIGIEKAHAVICRMSDWMGTDDDNDSLYEEAIAQGLSNYTTCVQCLESALWAVKRARNRRAQVAALLVPAPMHSTEWQRPDADIPVVAPHLTGETRHGAMPSIPSPVQETPPVREAAEVIPEGYERRGCGTCGGKGSYAQQDPRFKFNALRSVECPDCKGGGSRLVKIKETPQAAVDHAGKINTEMEFERARLAFARALQKAGWKDRLTTNRQPDWEKVARACSAIMYGDNERYRECNTAMYLHATEVFNTMTQEGRSPAELADENYFPRDIPAQGAVKVDA